MASATLMQTKDGRQFYKIQISRGHGVAAFTCRWYCPEGWSKKAIERGLQQAIHEFQSKVDSGEVKSRAEQKAEEKAAAEEQARIKTFEQYADMIFMPEKARTTAEGTRAFYENMLNKHLIPAFGAKKITEITSDELRAFFNEKLDSDLSKSSINGIYVTASQIFDMMFQNDSIPVNPMLKVKKPHRSKTEELDTEEEQKSYSVEQMQLIFKKLEAESLKWRCYVRLLADTGARRGEACGLIWKNVDFANNRINIMQNLCYSAAKGVYLDQPKTAHSKRTIDVDPEVMVLLKQLKEQTQKAIDKKDKATDEEDKTISLESARRVENGFVFLQDDKIPEVPMNPQSPSKYFKKFGEKIGIPGFHPHGLRHSVASIAITHGADIVSVSEKLGHSDPSITMGLYSHASAESIKRAGDVYREALKVKQA